MKKTFILLSIFYLVVNFTFSQSLNPNLVKSISFQKPNDNIASNHFIGIIQSFVWVIFHPHIVIKRRIRNRRIRKVKDSNAIKNMYWGSIVFDYHIRRIKKSSEIITE